MFIFSQKICPLCATSNSPHPPEESGGGFFVSNFGRRSDAKLPIPNSRFSGLFKCNSMRRFPRCFASRGCHFVGKSGWIAQFEARECPDMANMSGEIKPLRRGWRRSRSATSRESCCGSKVRRKLLVVRFLSIDGIIFAWAVSQRARNRVGT